MHRLGLLAAWLLATLVATAGAWQVVGAAESQVFDGPLTPVIAMSSSTAETDGGSSTVSDAPSTSDLASTVADPILTTDSTPGTTGQTTPSAASGEPGIVSSTTRPSPSTTRVPSGVATTLGGVPTTMGGGHDDGGSGASPGERATLSVPTQAGTVTASGTEPALSIVAVLATPGWSYEVTDNDGDSVEVRFRRGDDEIRVEIEWRDGRLVADVDR